MGVCPWGSQNYQEGSEPPALPAYFLFAKWSRQCLPIRGSAGGVRGKC